MRHDSGPWGRRAEGRLRELGTGQAGWSVCQALPPDTESMVLSCCALLAASPQAVCAETLELLDASADVLARRQQADGAVFADSDGGPADCRSTAWAALLWSHLPDRRRSLARAIRFLLEQETCAPPSSDDEIIDRGVVIGGWPWCDARGGWAVATSVTLLVLGQNQLAGHARVADSLQWIRSQALPDGGWSDPTRDAPCTLPVADAGATGLVLLALRATGVSETPAIRRACEFLAHTLPGATRPEQLGWGLLGWSSWRALPADAGEWLAQCVETTPGLWDSPEQLALLLLAAAPAAFRSLSGLVETSDPVEPWHPLLAR